MAEKLRGTLKSMNIVKGYGFIHCNGEEYFVHSSAFKEKPFKTIPEGTAVLFNPSKGAKGLRAEEVELVLEHQEDLAQ